jgi:hypothetical protein
MFDRKRFAAVLAIALGVGGCSMFQIKGTVTTTKTVNGQTTTTTREFENWEEMKQAMDEAGKEMRATTKELMAKLTEAPPPGEVKLGDLSPALASYEGRELDFITAARSSGEHEFSYVQIGVPSYDEFFKAAAEFHAFVYQTRESVRHVRGLAKTRLGGSYQDEMSLGAAVDAALANEGEAGEGVGAGLAEGRDLALSLAQAAPMFVQKMQALISAGQQLIAGAASSITNPKTLLHLDLITKGLGQSVKVVGESGKLLGEATRDLGSLGG